MSKQLLTPKLNQFKENIKIILQLKKAKKNEQNDEKILEKVQNSNRLVTEINRIFKQIYNNCENDVRTDKLKKEFQLMLVQHEKQLKELEKKDRESIAIYRNTLTNLRKSMVNGKSKQKYDDEDSERGIPNIQMYEVNQQTLHYERMIELKEKQINQIKGKMQDAIRVQQDMKDLVVNQGQKLNQVEANIDQANENVHAAHQNLVEAVDMHMNNKKKKIICFLAILGLVVVVTVPIIVHFT